MTDRERFIRAVRKDAVVGRGSCSSIDECYDDNDLWEVIGEARSEVEAVRLAREAEGLWLDRACDARWGEDDDPQLEWKRDFEKGCESNPLKEKV